jgi:hypothetical protein
MKGSVNGATQWRRSERCVDELVVCRVGRRQLVLVGRRRRKGYGTARDKKKDATGEQRRDSHGIDRIKKRTTGEWTSA